MKGINTPRLFIGATLVALSSANTALAEKAETEKLYDFDNKVHYYKQKLAKTTIK